MVREHSLRWGSVSACDCLGVAVCRGTVTSPAITNLSLHLAACEAPALHVSAGRISSPFLNLLINILDIQVVQLKSQGPDLGSREYSEYWARFGGCFGDVNTADRP